LHTDIDTALGDHGTVDLVDDAINLLERVRVRDHLVAGEEILYEGTHQQNMSLPSRIRPVCTAFPASTIHGRWLPFENAKEAICAQTRVVGGWDVG
jgi:hypothetical protein